MKQGSGNSRAGSRKIEPIAHPIPPKVAAGIGIQQVRTKPVEGDRGFLAPAIKLKSHRSGSQGGY